MFNVNLYREPHGLQDTIEVEVLKQEDERFLKRNRIQVDMVDKIFEVVLVARLEDGRELSLQKRLMRAPDAFSAPVAPSRPPPNQPALLH